METRKTPDKCFENLPDYDFEPHYVTLDDDEGGTLDMHYIEAGAANGQPVVMIHGNPTWSFMWRKIMRQLGDAGYRAIAIDLIGMGRSDKPTKMSDYTIARHEKWVRQALFDKLDLNGVHLVLHDWGGIIGLRVAADAQDRLASIAFSNTGLPVRDPRAAITQMAMPGAGLLSKFQLFVRFNPFWRHWHMLAAICRTKLAKNVVAAYAAPYPNFRYLTGNRQFTQMLPTRFDNPMLADNFRARQKLASFDKPFLCLFSDKDIVAPDGHKSVRPFIKGAAKRAPVILKGGSHFLVEDIPDAYGAALLDFLKEIG
ncbi:haloalkane dehalogenase [Alphaproteobacteria bacterium]|nr:haloalkane dehalogenase [Alphaproteobacteria bacterium]MDA8666405.1 haloalkane dehalogenase [Alphaproteobacteria bacterium]MDA8779912.1 haloalkane dehalogenase [Alphaproteobacteria bacterium]MDB2406427.1 haloalkane dehalogenase [Alphaproteobacteria bacterium]MDB2461913.1 haloalkane dehalogenase [Alphaproteobacteria bacterium]